MLFQIHSKDLLAIVNVCGRCIDKDSSRFCLGGIRFEVDGKTLTAIGTDGRQLAKYSCDIAAASELKLEFVLDVSELKKIAARLASKNCSFVSVIELTIEANRSYAFSWSNGLHGTRKKDYQAVCPVIDGRFPNWQQVFPVNPIGTCKIDRNQWVKAWNDSQESTAYRIRVNGSVEVESPKPPRLERIDHTGEDFATLINLDWLMGHLGATPATQVEIRNYGESKPIHLVDRFSEYLLMPMADH